MRRRDPRSALVSAAVVAPPARRAGPRAASRPAPEAHAASARLVGRNSLLQAGADAIGKVGQFLLYAVMARAAGRAAFGDFTSAASLSVLVMVAAFGVDFRVTRLVARREADAADAFWGALLVKMVLGSVLLAAAVAVAVLGPYEHRVVVATLLLGLAMLVELAMATPQAALRGSERVRPVAEALVLYRLLLAGGGVAVLLAGASIEVVAGLWLGSALAGLLYTWAAARGAGFGRRPRVSRRALRALATDSLALGFAAVFGAALSRLDVVILGLFKKTDAVALYGGAYRLMESSQFVTTALALTAFPALARLGRGTTPTIGDAFEFALKMVLVVTGPIAVGLAVYARPALRAAYGDGFDDAVPLLVLLAPLVVLAGICSLATFMLTAQRRSKAIGLALGLSAVVNVGLDLLLVPGHAGHGAAIAMIVTMGVMTVALVPATLRATGPLSLMRVLPGPVAAAACMADIAMLFHGSVVGLAPALAGWALTLALFESYWYRQDALRVRSVLGRRAT